MQSLLARLPTVFRTRRSASSASHFNFLCHGRGHGHSHQRSLKTLTLNAGSTTLKYALYDIQDTGSSSSNSSSNKTKGGAVLKMATGMVDRVGSKDASITHNGTLVRQDQPIESHVDALQHVVHILQQEQQQQQPKNGSKAIINGGASAGGSASPPLLEVDCIGHRVVHGGHHFSAPVRITPEVIATIESLCPLAPLHNPPALAGIRASQELFGGGGAKGSSSTVEQIAVFDTAFHTASMSPSSYRYAIPQQWAEDFHIRRYGFHGTSYQYVLDETTKYMMMGSSSNGLNCIMFHLGGK